MEPSGVVPVTAVRERVIQTLTEAFANDLITIDELESRLERAYRAGTAAEIESLAAGLARAPVVVREERAEMDRAMPRERLRSILSSLARRGVWTVPRQLDVLAVFSDTTIDLSAANLPPEIVDIHVRAIAASLTIVVPPGLRVVNRIGAVLANVESDTALDLAPMKPGSPVIRLTGSAFAANVEIVASPANPVRDGG